MKTLKDIEFEVSAVDDYATVWNAVQVEVLRQEAIKWIKELDEIRKAFPKQVTKGRNIQEWIKMFFNLTDEDLK